MRKHDVRKWLHAVLDLLPVILIPVFMIYSHRHTLTERTTVDVQYKYQSNEVNSFDDLVEGNIYQLNLDNKHIDDFVDSGGFLCFYLLSDLSFNNQEESISPDDMTTGFEIFTPNTFLEFNYFNDICIRTFFSYTQWETQDYNCSYLFDTNFTSNCIIQYLGSDYLIGSYTLFEYTDYNVIESVDVQDENADIMSVFMDDFNNSIDKYFNMGNVFGLQDVYTWFNINIFNGHAPTVMFSVWNIVLYEFVMDLMFLLYGLFMWFIDMVENLMDKPFKSIK